MGDTRGRHPGVHQPFATYSHGPVSQSSPALNPVQAYQPYGGDLYGQNAYANQYAHSIPYGNSLPDAIYSHRPTPEASFDSYAGIARTPETPLDPMSRHLSNPASVLMTNGHEERLRLASYNSVGLLLSLAEEYLAVAYQMSSKLDGPRAQSTPKEYYRLVATALGCMETVVTKCRLPAQQEAAVRLRYATILHEETENGMEAEEALSKGIMLADRHKLFALKYSMQHLLARILFGTSAPAAFKYLDGAIKDAEAYQHFPWLYALSFLKYSLHLRVVPVTRQETTSAHTALTKIKLLAEQRGDSALVAFSVVMKAWMCLKASNSHESFEDAQTLLAEARALQERPVVKLAPQIPTMIAFVDLCCYLQRFDPDQASDKLRHVNESLQLIEQASNYLADGSFKIPVLKDDTILPRTKDDIVIAGDRSHVSLMLKWKPKNDIYTVGYLLSGITIISQARPPKDKPEQMLKDGIIKGTHDQRNSDLIPSAIIPRGMLQLWRQHLHSYMRLYLAFMQCMRSNWEGAFRLLQEFHTISAAWSMTPLSLVTLSRLLDATYLQVTGSIPNSLKNYQSLVKLRMKETTGHSHMVDDVCRIAALNSLMIIRDPGHDGFASSAELFADLGKDCPRHPDKRIQAAYNLVRSILEQSSTIIGRKQTLQFALNAAKTSHSNTVVCICLSLMHWHFFRDQVTEQAEKSARAAQNMANRVGNKMWASTTAGILGDHLEAAGRSAEAANTYAEGCKAIECLPPQVKMQLGLAQPVGDSMNFDLPGTL